VAEKNSLINFQ